MHHSNPLESMLFFLIAAVIAVPLFKRFRLGAILGYLFAGVLIGPEVLNLINHPESILHFAEIGVVLLLFVIGLELNPEKLWRMRSDIALLGGGQLLLCATVIAAIVWALGLSGAGAWTLGLALALSSTAFAIQLMAEKGILASASGRRGFAILLMQDLAVIPILLLVQVLADSGDQQSQPVWLMVLAVVILLLCGRFVLNPLLSIVARYGSRETMTATALLIVVGSAYLMQMCGLSMGMGAFIAGIMLANSHFRHQLETDIEPFKGLTLGLFFIAIGMTLDVGLLLQKPLLVLLLALSLIGIKASIIAGLLRAFKTSWHGSLNLGLMLGQGGEFAFVIMAQAGSLNILPAEHIAMANLVVGISMVLTVPAILILDTMSRQFNKVPDTNDAMPEVEEKNEILLLGFGRFAQITGRILAANHIPFTALDNNPSHIKFVQQFGSKIHFGDITRLDVLQAAGLDTVQTVLLSLKDAKQSVEVVKMIRNHYPDMTIIARAYNRTNYLQLISAGADKVVREVFSGSLEAAAEALSAQGFTTSEALKTVELFRQHDENLLERSMEHEGDLDKLIQIGIQGRQELEELFQKDREEIR